MQNDTAMLADRKLAPEHLGRVLVLGLGKSGHDAVEYLKSQIGGRVSSLSVFGGKQTGESDAFAAELRAAGADVAFGEDAVPALAKGAQGHFDLCIASPGISEFSDLYQSALAVSDEVISEVEFAWRESARDSRWVAITGTNG